MAIKYDCGHLHYRKKTANNACNPDMLTRDALHGRVVLRLRLGCWDHGGLGQACRRAHLDTVGNPMLAPLRRRPLIVFALAVAIDHEVGRDPVGLAKHPCGAIGQQLDIATQHEGNRLVHPAICVGQRGFGLHPKLLDKLTKQGAVWGGGGRHGYALPISRPHATAAGPPASSSSRYCASARSQRP